MAEKSLFWTDSTGDGGPYSQTQLAEWLEYLFTTDQAATEGVLKGANNELAVSGASSPVAVATGAAIVKGHWYRNTAAVNVAVASPAAATRIDRVVLQTDWAAQTVRIALVAGVEGGAAPALTQTDGTKWEIPLAQVSITTGGVITLTDERVFCHFGTKVNTAMLDTGVLSADAAGRAAIATDYFDAATVLLKIANGAFGADAATRALFANGIWEAAQLASDAVETAKIKDAAVTTDKILALAVTTGKIDNLAVTTGKIDNAAVIESKIADGAVTTDKIYALNVVSSKIANGAVGPTKLADAAVETAKVKDDAVTADKLAHSLDAQPIGLNADKVDGYHASEIIASGLFVGMITPFYGSLGGSDGHRPLVGGSPKEDWHVCNGELVGGVQTPNLQGRTVVGVGGTLGASLGDVGGQITLNLAHYHSDGTLSAASHTHGYVDATGYPVTGLTYWVDATPETGNVFLAIASAHTHSTTNATLGATADVTGNTGTALSASQNIMNPYMALYWIMKVV